MNGDEIDITKLNEDELLSLKNKIGIYNLLKLFELYDNGGSEDYTADKYKYETVEPSEEEIYQMFMKTKEDF